MDSQTCSIILLRQTNPFYISDNDENDACIDLLQNAFGHVHKESSLNSCINYIKQRPPSPTLLLVELDDTKETHQQSFITQTVDKLSSRAVPVIVLSTRDDPQFMTDCIHAGATDYLLRPLRPDVIKTLFLNLVRCGQQTSLYQDHLKSSSTISTITSVVSPITPTAAHHCTESSAYLPDQIQDRIKLLNTKDTSFTKAIIDTFIPSTTDLPECTRLTDEHRNRLAEKVSSWDFSPLNLSHDDLIHCSVIIISQVFQLGELAEFSEDQLYSFITELASIYHDENPYHNFAHAVDVLQCISYFLCQLGLLPFADGSPRVKSSKDYRILRPRDIFALFIAAIGHDTGHPGVNNAFLINTSAPLALLYNDHSVLESFHAMTLFQLIKKHKFDQMLGGTNAVEYIEFRKLVITTILATDMALHSDYVTKIKEQKQRLSNSDPDSWNATQRLEERLLFCSGLIKCADISNVARPFDRAYEWAQILVEEFASQGDLERELGMKVLPMNDRSQIVLEDSQIGFIRFMALGLFESIRDYMQELAFPVDHIKHNLALWEERKKHGAGIDDYTSTTHQTQEDNNSSSDATATADEDYHSQAVHTLAKMDMEDSDYSLPEMPALAMSNLSATTTKQYHQQEDWDLHQTSGPVYCSCSIQ